MKALMRIFSILLACVMLINADQLISDAHNVYDTDYDAHRETGYMYTALLYNSGSLWGWELLMSTNCGSEWLLLHHSSPVSYKINDISLTVSKKHCFVAITSGSEQRRVNVRRFRIEGAKAGVYTAEIFPSQVKELCLVSNQDSNNDDIIFLFVLTEDNKLRLGESTDQGVTWPHLTTYDGADKGLDACWKHPLYSFYELFASYWDVNNTLVVLGYAGPYSQGDFHVLDTFEISSGLENGAHSSVSGSGTCMRCYCDYTTSLDGPYYYGRRTSSNDGGYSWTQSAYNHWAVDVTCRSGNYMALAWIGDAGEGGNASQVVYMSRAALEGASLIIQKIISDIAACDEVKPRIEYVKGTMHGIVYVATDRRAYFDSVGKQIYGDCRLTATVISDGVSLSFPTEEGVGYVLEYTKRLPADTWRTLGDVEGTGDTATIIDEEASQSRHRFYRVRMK